MGFTSFKPSSDDFYDGFALCPLADTGTSSVWLRCVLAGGQCGMDRSEVYRQFAAQCLDMARGMDSQYDRTVLLEMALLWSRLAEHATQSAARQEATCPG
jgi:hypothetical protein